MGVLGGVGGCDVGDPEEAVAAGGVADAAPKSAADNIPGGGAVDDEVAFEEPEESLLLFC